jgi:putative hydrolase of the HAD superfamily
LDRITRSGGGSPLMIRAVTFDVTRTLLHCPRLGAIYSETLSRHGIEVSPAEAVRLVGEVWRELACSARPDQDRFTAHPEGSRGWWRDFVVRFCELIEAPPPSRFATAELYQCFARADSWEVYQEVPATLDRLRRRGLRLGVISNWDERLPGLLADLDLAPRFDAIVTSASVGVEKPDWRIFEAALQALDVAAGEAVHVGDSPIEDVEGAIAAGMQAIRLSRRTPSTLPAARSAITPPPDSVVVLTDLSLLPRHLAAGAPGAAKIGFEEVL